MDDWTVRLLTWQADWAYGKDDMAVRQMTRGWHMDQLSDDTCHSLIGCKGATWPNQGLPCGTI
jgi:hypothetical protein